VNGEDLEDDETYFKRFFHHLYHLPVTITAVKACSLRPSMRNRTLPRKLLQLHKT
jgi:hypothetical protein